MSSADETEMAAHQRALAPKIGRSKRFGVIVIGRRTLQSFSGGAGE